MQIDESRRLLSRLWMNAQPSVLSFICGAVQRFHDAEDILQQVAEEASVNFNQYDPSRPFVPWVIGIARFKVARYHRERRRDHAMLSPEALASLAEAHVEQHQRQMETIDLLEECMARLRPRQLEMLRLRYEQGCGADDIARAVGSTGGSVRVTLTRIRDRLLECIRSRSKGVTA